MIILHSTVAILIQLLKELIRNYEQNENNMPDNESTT